jgi:putative ABC transport system substrate-binding protein
MSLGTSLQSHSCFGAIMRRRDLLAFVDGATWPSAVRAQQSTKTKRIAMSPRRLKSPTWREIPTANLFEELKRLGYVEGTNLDVDRYSAEGRFDRYADLAREVVGTYPNLIFTTGPR